MVHGYTSPPPPSSSGGGSNPGGYSSSPLPLGWEEKVDPGSGKVYYVDHASQATQWGRPQASFDPPPPPPPVEDCVPAPPPPPPLWVVAPALQEVKSGYSNALNDVSPLPPPSLPESVYPSISSSAPPGDTASPPSLALCVSPANQSSIQLESQGPRPQGFLSKVASFGGLAPEAAEHVELSDVQTWKFTQTGMPYIEGGGDPNLEHSFKIGFFSGASEMELYYGSAYPQVRQYFNFLKYIVFINVLLLGASLISFVPHVRAVLPMMNAAGLGPKDAFSTRVIDILFVSSYQPSNDHLWVAGVTLSMVIAFLAGPMYFIASKYVFRDMVVGQNAEQQFADARFDIIADNKEFAGQKWWRLAVSYAGFVLCLGVPIIIMYLLLFVALGGYMQGEYDRATNAVALSSGDSNAYIQALIGVAVSSVVTVCNAVFEYAVQLLQGFERHQFWSIYRRHRLAKMTLFKVMNIMALFLLRYFADNPWYTCMPSRIGQQIFTFILLDLTLNNLIEFGLPLFTIAYKRCCGGTTTSDSDDDEKNEFELTDEYFEVVYRQYIMYMSLSVFPMITGITLIANIIEYPLDKLRLVYLCSKPKGLAVGGRRTLSTFLLFAAVAGLVTFPSGPAWYGQPAGPFLCWPCPEYSQIPTSKGSCGSSFEPNVCTAWDGSAMNATYVRAQVRNMLSNDAVTRAGASRWFDLNEQLFKSRRCVCRPCTAVIACGCDEPVLSEQCGPASDASMQCGKTRSEYSPDGLAGYQPRCDGVGGDAGKTCRSDSDCVRLVGGSRGNCTQYCPGGQSGCWNCPDIRTVGLVNPRVAKTLWANMTFCARCTRNSGGVCRDIDVANQDALKDAALDLLKGKRSRKDIF